MKTIKFLLPLFCLLLLFSCSKETEIDTLGEENNIELRNDGCTSCNHLTIDLVNTLTQTPNGCCIYNLNVSSPTAGCGQRIMTHRQSTGSTSEAYTGTDESYEIIVCPDEPVGVAVVDATTGEVCFDDLMICDSNSCGSCAGISTTVVPMGTYDDDGCCEYEMTVESPTPGCGLGGVDYEQLTIDNG